MGGDQEALYPTLDASCLPPFLAAVYLAPVYGLADRSFQQSHWIS